jgi:hypothetical protein
MWPQPIIVANRKEAGIGRDFRLEKDPPHYVRIIEEWPPGFESCYLWATPYDEAIPVAGISKPDACSNAEAFIGGSSRQLHLEGGTGGLRRPFSIRVDACWRDNHFITRCGSIGWVPYEIARELCRNFSGATFVAKLEIMFKSRSGLSPGVRIEIGCSSKDYSSYRRRAIDNWLRKQELEEWWHTTFTASEQSQIKAKGERTIYYPNSRSASATARVLSDYANQFRQTEDAHIANRLIAKAQQLKRRKRGSS